MLLTRPAPKFDECLANYLIRVSEQNGFKHIGYLLHYAGLNWKNNRAPIRQILSGEFDPTPLITTLGLPTHTSKIAPIYQTFRRVIDTSNVLVKFPKVCPECLEESGYCKYQWVLLPVVACSHHERMLVDVNPTSGKQLGWYRQYLNRFDGEDNYVQTDKRRTRTCVIQQSLLVESLISGSKPSKSIPVVLQDLEFREMLSLIHFIAHYQFRLLGGAFNPAGMRNNELAQHYRKVWEALKAWPDSFYALLSQYVKKPMSNKGLGGLNTHFRDIYERLHRQQEHKGIARIKAEFDLYIEQYWPGVLEPRRISRIQLASTSRNIISKKEAANILGSRPERVDKLVQQGRLRAVVFKGKAHYLRDQMEMFATEITSNWTIAETCEALEITRYQLKQLLAAGIIPALQQPDRLNRAWIIDKARCLALISSLQSNARRPELSSGTLTMAGVQRQGYSIVQLVLAMQRGELGYGISAEVGSSTSFKQFIAFYIIKMG